MDINFRPAAVDTGDGGRLAQEMAAEIAELYDGLDHNGPDMPAAGPAQLGPPAGGFWVGYDGTTAVCCGGIKRRSDTVCEIKKSYVVRTARGQGIARRMLTLLEGEARALGYAVVRLDTGPRQGDAQHLYETAGYVTIDNFNDHPMATYFGEKQL